MPPLEVKPKPVASSLIAALLTCFATATSWAIEDDSFEEVDHGAICSLIEREAHRNGLPPAFFARLIWKESRFDALAVSPKGAEGIAQFMPATAERRRSRALVRITCSSACVVAAFTGASIH